MTAPIIAPTNFSLMCVWQENNETRERITLVGKGETKGDEWKKSIHPTWCSTAVLVETAKETHP